VREQSPDVVLTLGVVAVAPVFVEESVLNVDDNENGGTVHGNDLSIPDGGLSVMRKMLMTIIALPAPSNAAREPDGSFPLSRIGRPCTS
jgi:hypothetical protein